MDSIPTDFSTHDRLDHIFHRQHSLVLKYMPIEKANGLVITEACPVDLDDRFGQARLKDFFWRFTEELGEAFEAYSRGEHDLFKEELIDALHFLVEIYLLADITPGRIMQVLMDTGYDLNYVRGDDKLQVLFNDSLELRDLKRGLWNTVYSLSLASNYLKNRPWKQSTKVTNRVEFEKHLVYVLVKLISVCKLSGLTYDETFKMYFEKSAVNHTRIQDKI